ncbi:MAG: LysE family transporter [Chitinivibrionia bacterium]|nr:LysE family transporter [Chitinivibrionia bacterium]
MMQYLLLGCGFAFAAAIQPGPLQAFLLSRVAATGWRRTLPACLAPLLSDGPIAVLVLLVLGQLSPTVQQFLRAAGGALLLYFAWTAFRQWRNPIEESTRISAPRTLLQAALVNVLNPNPYLGWALVLGPSAVSAWSRHPAYAAALIVSFYGTVVATMALFVILVGTARFLGPRGRHGLLALSALILAVLGTYLLITALRNTPLIFHSI